MHGCGTSLAGRGIGPNRDADAPHTLHAILPLMQTSRRSIIGERYHHAPATLCATPRRSPRHCRAPGHLVRSDAGCASILPRYSAQLAYWLTLAPLFGAVFLPPALSLCLDAPVRRSWPILLVALLTLALLVVGIPLVSSVFMASINSIAGVNYAVGPALIYAYIASIPLIITAAAAFTVGGLGGYAARWALTAMVAGVLAWAGIGVRRASGGLLVGLRALSVPQRPNLSLSGSLACRRVEAHRGRGPGGGATGRAAGRGVARLGRAQHTGRLGDGGTPSWGRGRQRLFADSSVAFCSPHRHVQTHFQSRAATAGTGGRCPRRRPWMKRPMKKWTVARMRQTKSGPSSSRGGL
jgi:hypothetical protein